MVRQLSKKSGQVLIEMVLILTLLVGAVVFVGDQFRQQRFIAQIISTPWKTLAGMIQNGVWDTPENSMDRHPNSFKRVTTPIGDKAK